MSSATTSWPRRARSSVTRPVPAPTSRIGPCAAAASSRQSADVGVVAAALDVVPDDVLGRGRHANDPLRRAARDEQLAQGEHRGVRRQRDEPAVAVGERGVERGARDRARTCRRSGATPAYFRRTASSAARVPLHVTRRTCAGDRLEVGVPHPGDVAPVGDLVVEDREDVVLAGVQRERAQHLVGAGRVLDEQDREVAAGDLHRLGAAEGGLRGLQARRRCPPAARRARSSARRRRARCRRCRGRGGGGRRSPARRRGAARSARRACRRA